MTSLFSGLSIAVSGLFASRRSLDTISHNIANVNNPSYVRQQAIHASSKYSKLPGSNLRIGSGVDIQVIRQIRDEFLNFKYRLQSQEFGYWSAKSSVFEQVQDIFNEISNSGLQNVMDQFWNSWEEAAKNPDNLTVRGLLKERAIAFTETVNHISYQLDSLQRNINIEIENKVSEINNIAKDIAKLNEKIMQTEGSGGNSNDYRDSRAYLLDKLSQIISIEYYEEPSGAVSVTAGGRHLVNSRFYNKILAKREKSVYAELFWEDTEEKVDVRGGEILGLIEARGDVEDTIIGKNNGTVNESVTINFLYDTGNPDLNNIVTEYTNDMTERGLDETINPSVMYGGGTIDDLINRVKTTFDLNDPAHKKLVIMTNGNITGITNDKLDELKSLGVSISVVSNLSNDWGKITDATGGTLFDINEVTAVPAEQVEFAQKLVQETTNTASRHMGNVPSFLDIIPAVKQKLNAFVNTIARNINYLHRKGKTLTGSPGEDFFVAKNPGKPIEAGNIKLNPNLDTLNNMALSQNGDRGDGKIAEQIATLRDEYMFANMNPDDYYRSIIAEIGVEANQVETMREGQEVLLQQIDNKRKELSSVSLDEEMAEMLKYQHSYSANSRVVNAIDEMLDRVINKTGVVGR